MKIAFELRRGRDGRTYWHLRSRNGEILAHSEGYARAASARRTIKSIVSALQSNEYLISGSKRKA